MNDCHPHHHWNQLFRPLHLGCCLLACPHAALPFLRHLHIQQTPQGFKQVDRLSETRGEGASGKGHKERGRERATRPASQTYKCLFSESRASPVGLQRRLHEHRMVARMRTLACTQSCSQGELQLGVRETKQNGKTPEIQTILLSQRPGVQQ